MPLYDYQCERCQSIFEVRASFQEKELGLEPVCPKCQSTETRQVLNAAMLLHGVSKNQTNFPPISCNSSAGQGCCG
jgi:putative FmdB family regulatory protein